MGLVIDALTERNFKGTIVSEELENDGTGAQKVRVVTWQRNKNRGKVAKRPHVAGSLFQEKWLNLKLKSPQHNTTES